MKTIIILGIAILLIIGFATALSLHPSSKIESLKNIWAENPNEQNTNKIVATCLDLNTEYKLCKSNLEEAERKARQMETSSICNCQSYPLGDANFDGDVNILDLIVVRNQLREK